MSDSLVEVFVNPLIFFGSEFRPNGLTPQDTPIHSWMGFLCAPGTPSDVPALVDRYNEVSVEKYLLQAAPNEQRLLDRLIWPLRHAKGSYVLGNYLGSIALCGLVAEMSSILAFDMRNELGEEPEWSEPRQIALFGSAFEKLGQERRVKILKELGIIDASAVMHFEAIRLLRRKYLHLWSSDHESLAADAVKCVGAAIPIVVAVLGISFDQGKLMLKPEVLKYLTKHGVASAA